MVGIQDSKSRYRSVDPRAMPKFGSEKKIYTENAGENGVRASVTKPSVQPTKAEVSVVAERNVEAAPADKKVGISRGAEKASIPVARQDRSGWVGQLGSKLSSLVSQRPKPAKGAIPRFNGVPVQGELSLDNIKVVRNDLSDADLEIVAKKAAQPDPEPNQPAIQERASRSDRLPTWERVTTMFSAVKS